MITSKEEPKESEIMELKHNGKKVGELIRLNTYFNISFFEVAKKVLEAHLMKEHNHLEPCHKPLAD